ncbi:urease accessory protein UreD [Bifidobacterium vansinderenii]|uniref:Urease accessory protein UreD n=1 Tax=Bifidobacterium vansinderenii TaxID=1984871 RepID=A0A229VVP3_9BIFI|nr:urease accessory protein UreD [Bifidobacterium vansinderenii]OXM99671.1 urease accessory protein [Bifidobacterium vansinderenii]
MPSSTFRLATAFRNGRTKIDDVYFEAPFKLMSPFDRGRHADFIVMLASPGFLKGDEAHIECTFGAGTDSTIKTQSYEKVLNTDDGSASRTIDLTAQGDAKAVFLPFPVIPFEGSTFSNLSTARISPESTFVYADVVTCGRVGRGERWQMNRFSNRLRVSVDESLASDEYRRALNGDPAKTTDDPTADTTPEPAAKTAHRGRPRKQTSRSRLVFADRLLLDPTRFDYTEMGMWREYTHCGVLYAHLPETDPGYDPSALADAPASPYAASGGAAAGAKDPRLIADPRKRIEAARVAAEDALITRIRDYTETVKSNGFQGEFGASRVTDGVCVRILTTRGDDAFDFIKAIADMV